MPAVKGSRWPESNLAPCGTESACRRHRRRGEPVDEACLHAEWLARTERAGSDPWNTAKGGGRPDFREIRNGLPEFKPYTYRGTGEDQYEHLYEESA